MKTIALAILVWAGVVPQTVPVNLDFESGTIGRAPAGWRTGTPGGAGFHARLVDGNCPQGRRCVMLSGTAPVLPGAFGTLYETVTPGVRARIASRLHLAALAPAPAKRHVRFRAAVRVEGPATRASLWIRSDRPGGGRLLQATPAITDSGWNYYQVDADIAPDAKQVVFGVVLFGPGKAWVDDASFVDRKLNAPKPARLAAPAWRV